MNVNVAKGYEARHPPAIRKIQSVLQVSEVYDLSGGELNGVNGFLLLDSATLLRKVGFDVFKLDTLSFCQRRNSQLECCLC